ncbi:hypothetical protein AB0K43_08370 [Kitasatospora sp. NPDC049258]
MGRMSALLPLLMVRHRPRPHDRRTGRGEVTGVEGWAPAPGIAC